jgi:hypothetical protein
MGATAYELSLKITAKDLASKTVGDVRANVAKDIQQVSTQVQDANKAASKSARDTADQTVKANQKIGESAKKTGNQYADNAQKIQAANRAVSYSLREIQLQSKQSVTSTTRLGAAFKTFSGFAGQASITLGAVTSSAAAAWKVLSAGSDVAGNAERQFLRLQNQVRATGGAAGFTAAELDKLARTEALATLGDTTGLRNAIGALTTFKSISGDVFTRTIQLAGDVAEVLGQNVTSATIQLSKALENPKQGISALTEVGVTFTNAEKEKIKALQESGDLLGAQIEVLKVLEGQFGGAGRAAAEGYIGAIDTLNQRWEELLETLGKSTLEDITKWIKEGAAALNTFNEFLNDDTEQTRLNNEVKKEFEQRLRYINEATGANYETWMDATRALGTMRDSAEQAGYQLSALDEAGKAAAAQADSLTPSINATSAALDKIDQAADKAAKTLSGSIKDMAAAYQDIDAQIAAGLPATLSAIEENYAARLSAVQNGNLSEQEQIRQTAQLVVDKEQEKIAAVNSNYSQRASLITEAFNSEIQIAAQAGLDTTEIERLKLEALNELAGEREAAYKASIDALVAEEQRLHDQAKALRESLKAIDQSQADYERQLRREGLSEFAQYQDQRKEIAEKNAAAEKALQAGNFEAAREYAQQALALVKQNDDAVKDGSKTVVSAETARKNALEDSRAATELLNEVTEQQAQATENAAASAGALADEFNAGLADVQGQLGDLKSALESALQAELQIKTDQAETDLRAYLDAVAQKDALLDVKLSLENAQAALSAFAADPRNQEMAIEARLALTQLESDAQIGRDLVAAIGDEKIIAQADFSSVLSGAKKTRSDIEAALEPQTNSTHAVSADTAAVRAEISALQRATSSTHTVYVRTVEKKQSGGQVGAKLDMGGHLPGYGGGDRVQALLEAGEFVVRKEAVQRVGVSRLQRLNDGDDVAMFARGGFVSFRDDLYIRGQENTFKDDLYIRGQENTFKDDLYIRGQENTFKDDLFIRGQENTFKDDLFISGMRDAETLKNRGTVAEQNPLVNDNAVAKLADYTRQNTPVAPAQSSASRQNTRDADDSARAAKARAEQSEKNLDALRRMPISALRGIEVQKLPAFERYIVEERLRDDAAARGKAFAEAESKRRDDANWFNSGSAADVERRRNVLAAMRAKNVGASNSELFAMIRAESSSVAMPDMQFSAPAIARGAGGEPPGSGETITLRFEVGGKIVSGKFERNDADALISQLDGIARRM